MAVVRQNLNESRGLNMETIRIPVWKDKRFDGAREDVDATNECPKKQGLRPQRNEERKDGKLRYRRET